MVEPQGGQVEHLAGLHCAVKGLGLAVTGVLGQIWSQGVQWDPRHLGTQQIPGSRPKAPRPSVNTMGPALLGTGRPRRRDSSEQSTTSPSLLCLFLRAQVPCLPPPGAQEQGRHLFHGLFIHHLE